VKYRLSPKQEHPLSGVDLSGKQEDPTQSYLKNMQDWLQQGRMAEFDLELQVMTCSQSFHRLITCLETV